MYISLGNPFAHKIAKRYTAVGFEEIETKLGKTELSLKIAWHARGHRFDPGILHIVKRKI